MYSSANSEATKFKYWVNSLQVYDKLATLSKLLEIAIIDNESNAVGMENKERYTTSKNVFRLCLTSNNLNARKAFVGDLRMMSIELCLH